MSAALLYTVALLVATLDQSVKVWAMNTLRPLGREGIAVIPDVFHLTYTQNEGMAFSLLQGQRVFLIGAAVLVMGGIVWAQRRIGSRIPVLLGTSLGLALGGALGNGIDRARLGFVVDLFDARLINFPIFNVADTAISIGIVLLAWRVAVTPPPDAVPATLNANEAPSPSLAGAGTAEGTQR
ncbi:MAG: signal peptidase II [Fibrella sp.]|nr:signal peptidase II [Armatimonadota bacterium]